MDWSGSKFIYIKSKSSLTDQIDKLDYKLSSLIFGTIDLTIEHCTQIRQQGYKFNMIVINLISTKSDFDFFLKSTKMVCNYKPGNDPYCLYL